MAASDSSPPWPGAGPQLSRREWLIGAGGLLAFAAGPAAAPLPAEVAAELQKFLSDNLGMTPAEMDAFVAGRLTDQRNRRFDPVLGYVSADGRYRHGWDGAVCTYSYDGNGARTMAAGAGPPCRINTYGDSFTECAQVSDGETWQERLAADLGEPVRNFGVGSYSVYQAYIRMAQKEQSLPASTIVFNIFSEDHFRNLKPMVSPPYPREHGYAPLGIRPFVSANAATGAFRAHHNPCPNPVALRRLADPAWLARTLGREDEIRLLFARAMEARRPSESIVALVREIAGRRRYAGPIDGPASALTAIDAMETSDALYSSMKIVDLVQAFARALNKRVLFVLSHGEDRLRAALTGGKRFDQPFIDFLRRRNITPLDMIEQHRRDFAAYRIRPEEYIARFFVPAEGNTGHYNPSGNLFQAFALKDRLVALLDPKPPAYQPLAPAGPRGTAGRAGAAGG